MNASASLASAIFFVAAVASTSRDSSNLALISSIDARSAETVIPDSATLAGSIRLQSSDMREQVESLIREIAEASAGAYGVSAEVEITPRYGATCNHSDEAGQMRSALAVVLGDDWQCDKTPVPIMASEDFSYYLNAVPGAFALIGAGDGDSNDYPCHNPYYDFRDALIPDVARVFLQLAGAPMPPVNA